MDDLLTRAWNLLGEGERPEGMVGPNPNGDFGEHWPKADILMPDRAARDRLTVAVEGVLIRNLWGWGWGSKGYNWFHLEGDDDIVHPDRLTAAVLALEAERGGQ